MGRAQRPSACFARRRGDQMNYHVHILKGYGPGTEQIIEKRTHTADSDLEAMRTLRESFHIFAPTASGFSPRRKDGAEIYRWFKTAAQSPGDNLGDN
jgi:hypothetical protein